MWVVSEVLSSIRGCEAIIENTGNTWCNNILKSCRQGHGQGVNTTCLLLLQPFRLCTIELGLTIF